jgi:putative DNA primase/helicase
MVTPRPKVSPVRRGDIPKELMARPQWVNWRFEERGDGFTKVPYTPGTDRRASSTDLLTWGTLDEALASMHEGHHDGIGFMFSSADPYCGVDLDGCRNPETGELEARAKEIVDDLNGYAEVSPSGRGVHVIVRGKVPNRRRREIEVYASDRFFTMTGQRL